jgi:hypothetical protein
MAPKMPTAARLAVLILACLGFAGLMEGGRPATAQTDIQISACQRIDAPGHYVLTTDLDGAPLNVSTPAEMVPPYTGERTLEHTRIEITASDVTLDCQEYTLTGSGDESSDTTAIYMTGSHAFGPDDFRRYTGFGAESPCDAVFEGGPNLKDTGAAACPAPASPVPANSGTAAIKAVQVVGDPVYYPSFGDLWMSTWADDNRLFFSWGDGAGMGYGYPVGYPAYQSPDFITPAPCVKGDLFPCELWCNINLCDGAHSYPPARLVDTGVLAVGGPVPAFDSAEIVSLDVPSGDPFILQDPGGPIDIADRNDKPSSLLFYDGRLYFAGHLSTEGPGMGYLAYSDDYGQTWTEVPNSPWGATSNFRVLMFINMGQAYTLNQDGYVYALGIGQETDWQARSVYLARVPTSSITDYGAYEYFTGMNGDTPQWASAQSDATPLDALSTIAQGSAIYHAGTGQYLFMSATTDYMPVPDQPFGYGGLFAAPQPWGPWKQVGVLCFAPECDDGGYDPVWTERDMTGADGEPGKYIPGLISKGARPDYVYFSIAGGSNHYQLQIGKLEFDTGP